MTRLEIHLDAETLQPIIQAVADGEIKAVKLSGRVLFSDDALRDCIARKEATATDDAAQLTWGEIVATRPTLAELEKHVSTMRVATSTPGYGRDWLEIDDRIYEITGRAPAYQTAREHLHKLYTDRALGVSDTTEDEANGNQRQSS